MKNHCDRFPARRVVSTIERHQERKRLKRFSQAVAGMDKKEFESKVYLTYVDRFQIPLGIALFFILFGRR